MELVIQPRQSGKTYRLVHDLVLDPEVMLIVSSHQEKDGLRDVVHGVLRATSHPHPRPILTSEVDEVMRRVRVAALGYPIILREELERSRVLIDNGDRVLQALFNASVITIRGGQ
jgi:hypothetical protein